MRAKDIIDRYMESAGDMSQRKVADVLGWSPSTLSMVLAGTYANLEQKEAEMAKKLLGIEDETEKEFEPIRITEKIIGTDSYFEVFSLCNGLIDRNSSLTASIGLVIGDAGMGKTTAVQSFAAETPDAVYVLYMGFNRNALFREIAEAIVGRSSARSYYENLQLIMGATRVYRKLIIVDEADRMPISMLEDLRTLNEYGRVPLLLVGEPKLAATVKKADRIESRIRKPRVTFKPIDNDTLSSLYEDCCGMKLPKNIIEILLRMSQGDFRVAANDMQNIVRLMNINHKTRLTETIINLYKSGQEILNEHK